MDRGDHLDGRIDALGDIAAHAFAARVVEQVELVENHQIGGGELIFVQLVKRGRVIEGGVGGALAPDAVGIGGEGSGKHRRRVDHGENAVDRQAGPHLGPGKGLEQRLGQRQARGLDDDVLGRIGAIEQ